MNGWKLGGLGMVWAACAGAPSGPPAAEHTPSWQQLAGQGLGTTWSVQWAQGPDAEVAQGLVVDALSDVDRKMSTWRDDSEIMRLRGEEGAQPISAALATVVDASLDLHAMSGGAFDPTVQPLMELWGLHGEPRRQWPSVEELSAVEGQVGAQRLRLNHDPEGGTLDVGPSALDLSSIAKGYAVDRVFEALSAAGATSVMVEVGGEVRVAGPSTRGEGWRLGIERPAVGEAPGQLVGVAQVSNGALATSGNYRSRYLLDGRVVHHTLDPRTLGPAQAHVVSATVWAPTTMWADGWATALMVLGADEGLPLIDARPELEAWLLEWDGTQVVVRASSGASSRVSGVNLTNLDAQHLGIPSQGH